MKKITYSEDIARSIQNFGEQDPRINNAEMKRWRKKWAEKSDEEYTVTKTRNVLSIA